MTQPTKPDAASILGAMGALGCIGLFLIVFLPLSAVILWAAIGPGPAIAVAVILGAIIAWVIAATRMPARERWRCPFCHGTFAAGSPTCSNCGKTVAPPPAS
jgi:hypothetical protein